MGDNKSKKESGDSKPKPKGPDFVEKRGKMDRDPGRDIRKVVDTHPPPDKKPSK